jgi:hypothetical protein
MRETGNLTHTKKFSNTLSKKQWIKLLVAHARNLSYLGG